MYDQKWSYISDDKSVQGFMKIFQKINIDKRRMVPFAAPSLSSFSMGKKLNTTERGAAQGSFLLLFLFKFRESYPKKITKRSISNFQSGATSHEWFPMIKRGDWWAQSAIFLSFWDVYAYIEFKSCLQDLLWVNVWYDPWMNFVWTVGYSKRKVPTLWSQLIK